MTFINDFLDSYFGNYMPDKKESIFHEEILLKHRNYIYNPFRKYFCLGKLKLIP